MEEGKIEQAILEQEEKIQRMDKAFWTGFISHIMRIIFGMAIVLIGIVFYYDGIISIFISIVCIVGGFFIISIPSSTAYQRYHKAQDEIKKNINKIREDIEKPEKHRVG